MEGNSIKSQDTPSLTPRTLSFDDNDEEDCQFQKLLKLKCKFFKYEKEWLKVDDEAKVVLGKDLRRGIHYGVVWLIVKSCDGRELISHAVEPNVSN